MSRETRPPPPFEALEGNDSLIWTRPVARGWVKKAMDRGETLHEAAGRSRRGRTMTGRGTVFAIPAPEGEADGWVVRHYRRGGRVASLLGDRYLRLGPPRPFRELRASEEVRARRIPTPRVLAAAVYPSGPVYRGDLVTELVPDALELAEILFDPDRRGVGGAADRKEALGEAGSLIRRMGEAGIYHPDLNARNVLLQWYAAPDGRILDLDRCRVGDGPDPAAASRMHRRLLRSIRKLEKKTGLPVPEGERKVLRTAVERGR